MRGHVTYGEPLVSRHLSSSSAWCTFYTFSTVRLTIGKLNLQTPETEI